MIRPETKEFHCHHYDEVVVSSSLTAPPVRMMVIQVAYDEEQQETFITKYPVVAIESRVSDKWEKYEKIPVGQAARRGGYTRKSWEELGWKWHSEHELKPIVIDDEYGLADLETISSSNTVEKVFCCPWDQSQDDVQLREDIAMLSKSIKDSVLRSSKRRITPNP